jgi:isoquinoline 1-oxidoreductase beta subunit
VGALVVGWGVLPRQRLHAMPHPLPLSGDAVALNGWIALGADGTVSWPCRAAMGQGATALPMLVAEELDVPLSASAGAGAHR